MRSHPPDLGRSVTKALESRESIRPGSNPSPEPLEGPQAPLLDYATHSVFPTHPKGVRRGWHFVSYPAAGEISAVWHSGGHKHEPQESVGQSDPERNKHASASRSVRTLRRYCVANGLNHLWTLTYAPEHLPDDIAGVWKDIESFRRNLHAAGYHFPVAAVIERGSESGRLHVHLLVAGRQPIEVVRRCWGRGFVQVEPPPKLKGLSKRARLRLAAAYLTKYVGKDFDASAMGKKRYSTTRGFQPVRRTVYGGLDLWDGLRWMTEGSTVAHYWQSPDDFPGPPVMLVWLE